MRAAPRSCRASLAMALALAATAPAAAAERMIEGELIRVDLRKRILVVRPLSGIAREIDVKVVADTLVSAAGRAVPLEELKTGQRVVVACEVQGAEPCPARRVRAGPLRHAVPP